MKTKKLISFIWLPLILIFFINDLGFTKLDCDKSEEGTLPFGQKRLTTPWPKINGERGPIAISLKDAESVTLSWDAGGLIHNCVKIEYEVKFNSNFKILDKDDPERIQHGVIDEKSGKHSLNLLTKNHKKGTYYIRIAAQNNSGKDVALRSQPVIVNVDPPLGYYDVEIPYDQSIANIVASNNNFQTTTRFKHYGYYGYDPPLDQIYSSPIIKAEFFWETSLFDCAFVLLIVSNEEKTIYSEQQIGEVIHRYDESFGRFIERKGCFDLTSFVRSLKWGRKYQFIVIPYNYKGQPAGIPSDPKFLKVYYRSPYLITIPDKVIGQNLPEWVSPTPQDPKGIKKKEIRKIEVTPSYNPCIPGSRLPKHALYFSEPVNENSVINNLSFFPPWPDVEIEWSQHDNITEMAYGNLSNLWFDTVYTVTLDTGAKTKTGKTILETPVQWLFKTYPYTEKCPEVVFLDVTPKPVLVPPANSHLLSEDMHLFLYIMNAEFLSTKVFGIKGKFKNYPTLTGGLFKYFASARWPLDLLLEYGLDEENASIELYAENALGKYLKYHKFAVNEMAKINADLAIKGVSWKNGKFAIHVVNNGPDTLPATHTRHLNIDSQFMLIKNKKYEANSHVNVNQNFVFSKQFSPNTERIVLAETNDVPEGVIMKHHWYNPPFKPYAMIHFHYQNGFLFLLNDPNMDNNKFFQKSPF